MGQQYSASNVTIGVMFLMTAFTFFTRFRFRLDHNWPLVYYLAVVLFHQWVPGSINPWVLYVGVVLALLLRFEFMGGGFLTLMRAIELCVIAFLAYTFFAMLMF
jgi:hypothetical protein